MKKILLLVVFASVLVGCNANPNKEARIQRLEAQISMVTDKLKETEKNIQLLKVENERLKTRIDVLELP